MTKLADFIALTKPRPAVLVMLTVATGFVLGSNGPIDQWLLWATLIGIGFVAGGVGALNQYMERHLDAKMHRTQTRPLPAGRLTPREAVWFGVVTCVLGVWFLWAFVNPMTALLGAVTAAVYVLVYTPLKVKTTFNTLVGAVAGALPPMIGWAGATGEVVREAWYLFAILFVWQLPHFFAIAWFYREDYARAGMKMVGVVDRDGRLLFHQLPMLSLILIPVSLLPATTGFVGRSYSMLAIGLGIAFLAFGISFSIHRSNVQARRVFLASLVYLPALLGMMVLDRAGLV